MSYINMCTNFYTWGTLPYPLYCFTRIFLKNYILKFMALFLGIVNLIKTWSIMKSSFIILNAILICFLFSSCSAIEGIFKAGVWAGILLVVVVVRSEERRVGKECRC